jgi:hypothetical protein
VHGRRCARPFRRNNFLSSALLLHRLRVLARRAVKDVDLGHVFEIEAAYETHCTAAVRALWRGIASGHGQAAVGMVGQGIAMVLSFSRHPPARAQCSRPCLQTHIRRLGTTRRFGCGDQENAQTILARSDPHHTAHTHALLLYS